MFVPAVLALERGKHGEGVDGLGPDQAAANTR